METTKTKILAIVITIILALSVATSAIPSLVAAHTPPVTWPTLGFINVAPNPVGLGQTVTVNFWVNQPTPTANGVYGDRWHSLTVSVGKPDGTNATLGPFTADATGGTFTLFTPDSLGNYTFQFIWPGQVLTGENPPPTAFANVQAYIGDTFAPCKSPLVTLTVQQEAIKAPQDNPLPTGYWQRPISALNANWYPIGGNWLGLGQSQFSNTGLYNVTGNYNPYSTGPLTPHILWTKPVAFGGTVGGTFGGSQVEGSATSNYYSASQYEPKFDPIILNGILYYELYPGSNQNPAGITAVDLRTGKTLWTDANLPYLTPAFMPGPVDYGNLSTTGVIPYTTTLRTGQILNAVTPNQYGGLAYLWYQLPAQQAMRGIIDTYPPSLGFHYETPPPGKYWFDPWAPANVTYMLVDAMTGTHIAQIVNATTMQLTEDTNGDLIGYYVNWTDPNAVTLVAWNSTQAIMYANGKSPAFADWYWRPVTGAIYDFNAGIMWTAPLPKTSPSGTPLPGWNIGKGTPSINWALSVVNDELVCIDQNGQGGFNNFYNPGWEIEAGFNATTGTQLFMVNQTLEAQTREILGSGLAGSGVYIEVAQDSMTVKGFSLTTGKNLWTTQLNDWNPYNSDGINYVVANGTFYLWGLGGDVWRIDMLTGTVAWHFKTGDAGIQTPYGIWPLWTFTVGTVAGGVLFVPEGHQYSPPMFHGAQQLALNITNGQQIWSIDGFDVTTAPAIADGIATTLNAYDNQIYTYGQGQTATTVSTQPVQNNPAQVLIQGTVTDQSPGQTCLGIPAAGTPAISDDSMSQWMEYLYMQQPKPTNAKGVLVTLSTIDPNNNIFIIGTTSTEITGQYSFTYTPNVPGTYKIIATFGGSNSYYGSTAQTSMAYELPTAHESPTPAPPASAADLYFVPATAGLFVLIIIVLAIVLLLTFRKRP
ncbi:MAG TPA: PQQ-binding-like beta-propeller repeat protein [Candidatus Binatia bacterium]|nr:PQQ-binding-like beta-propeller repeat protein [Candidatus Binatia bacterium]